VSAAKREPSDGGEIPVGDLGIRLEAELVGVDSELAEIEMLGSQARTEAGRHEQNRVQTTEKLTAGVNMPAEDLVALSTQLVTLTRRAAVMEAQVDLLEGKRKTLGRFRDMLVELATVYGGTAASVPLLTAGEGAEGSAPMSRIAWLTRTRTSSGMHPTSSPCTTSCSSAHCTTSRSPSKRTDS